TNTISGTSMATPHVTGAAALYLNAFPDATPAEVHAGVVNNATTDRLTNVGSGSPNRLLYSLFGGQPVDNPPVASFTFGCGGPNCAFDGSASKDDNGISAYGWDFGDGQTGSGLTTNHTYASASARTLTFTVPLTVTDTAGH